MVNLLGSHNHRYSKLPTPENGSGKPCQVTRDYREPHRPRFVIEAEMFSLHTFLEREAFPGITGDFCPTARPCAGGTSHQLCGMGWPRALGLDEHKVDE